MRSWQRRGDGKAGGEARGLEIEDEQDRHRGREMGGHQVGHFQSTMEGLVNYAGFAS